MKSIEVGKYYSIFDNDKLRFIATPKTSINTRFNKAEGFNTMSSFIRVDINDFQQTGNLNYWLSSIRVCKEATAEEMHWLQECIKYSTHISKEEALRTFKKELIYEIY